VILTGVAYTPSDVLNAKISYMCRKYKYIHFFHVPGGSALCRVCSHAGSVAAIKVPALYTTSERLPTCTTIAHLYFDLTSPPLQSTSCFLDTRRLRCSLKELAWWTEVIPACSRAISPHVSVSAERHINISRLDFRSEAIPAVLGLSF
jgi:hypothetical protein